MRACVFRQHLRSLLESNRDRVLLRVLVSRSDAAPVELTGADLLEQSLALADQYCKSPIAGVLLLLLPHSVELFLLHLGLILRERVPAILAWPTSRIDAEKYQRNLLHQLQNLPASQLLTVPRLAQNLDPGLPYEVTGCPIANHAQVEKSFVAELKLDAVTKSLRDTAAANTPADALFLQFSGGTTGAQKCVVVTSEMLVNQLKRLSDCLNFTETDGVASWLPLYHDMGLIACLWLPLWLKAASVQFSATDWLMDPGLLFRLMGQYRATFAWLPNFAFSYLAARTDRIQNSPDLGHVRAWINCSEPVRKRSFAGFVDAFAKLGIRMEQCQASYAMAENVFAVTQTPLESVPVTFPRSKVRGGCMDSGQVAYEFLDEEYVSSGRKLEGVEVRIRRADGNLSQEGEPGGIEIRSESLFFGYWSNDGFQTEPLLSDGWYATGDFGFVNGGDLYVIGRTKDIVIVAGQNVFPEDIEVLANTVAGVYPGRVVAFGIEDKEQGTENLAVIAEMRGTFDGQEAVRLERQIQLLVRSVIGMAPRYVRVVPERWIVKSTAGKISRRETRRRFLEEQGGANSKEAGLVGL